MGFVLPHRWRASSVHEKHHIGDHNCNKSACPWSIFHSSASSGSNMLQLYKYRACWKQQKRGERSLLPHWPTQKHSEAQWHLVLSNTLCWKHGAGFPLFPKWKFGNPWTWGSRSRAFGQWELRKGNPQLERGAALAAWHELTVWLLNQAVLCSQTERNADLATPAFIPTSSQPTPKHTFREGNICWVNRSWAMYFSPAISLMYAKHKQIQRSIMEEHQPSKFFQWMAHQWTSFSETRTREAEGVCLGFLLIDMHSASICLPTALEMSCKSINKKILLTIKRPI